MRALMYERPYKVTVGNKPDPRIEHPNDIILRVTRSAICGSDLHLLHGFVPDTRPGHTFGHEFAGEIVECGPGVRSRKVGDRVVLPFPIACGTCYFCSRGLTANCESTNPNSDLAAGVFGYSHMTGGYDGGQAEYVRVPFGDVNPFAIPDDMDEEDVLFLSDILPTGYQAAEMAEIDPGDTVAIFGAGPVGLFAARSAWLMGAGRVIVIDHVDYRLEFARRWANVETVNFRDVGDYGVVAWLRDQTEGRGPDACIDAVGLEAVGDPVQGAIGKGLKMEAGNPVAITWCIDAVRKNGHVSIVGVYGPPFNLIPIGTAMNKGLTLRMNQCNVHRYQQHLLDHIRAGRIDARGIISHRFPLEDAPHAYDIFSSKKDDCIKCVLVPGAGASQVGHA